jgi:hypothetical protein
LINQLINIKIFVLIIAKSQIGKRSKKNWLTGRSLLRRRKPTLKCSAIQEGEGEEEVKEGGVVGGE